MEAIQRKEDAARRMRENISRVGSQIADKQYMYIRPGPRADEIARRKNEAISRLETKRNSMYSKLADIERSIQDMRSKL